jgi:DNA-binding GntR family transcriptional regulator
VLLSLLIAVPTGDPVPIAALARRFSVSRAHVLTVLREAAELGLVQPSGPRGGYRAGPRLTTAFRRFFATMLLVQLHGIESARGAGALATSAL